MKNFKLFLALGLISIGFASKAQVGIGTNSPTASAQLDIRSSNKGLLIPQIALTSCTDAITISNPATSLLVYNTATTADVVPGYYYNSGTSGSPIWLRLNTGNQDLSGLATTASVALKVDKETGKGLSTNDYTSTEKTKLAAITGTNTGDQDLSGLATTASVALKANIASPTFTGIVSGIDKTMVGLTNVDNTTDLLKPISTATANALALKANIASPTFTGTVITPASASTGAGLRIPHGEAPSSPINGDIWTTTSGLFANINSAVKQFPTLSDGNNFSGNNTFSGQTLIFGNSTELSTVNIGIGANPVDIQKSVNIATNGAAGSNTIVRMGPIAGESAMTFGQSTATSTVNIGTGASVSESTKNINIATNGAAGSTTTVRMGPIAGESAMTFGQSTAASTVNIGTGATITGLTKAVNIGTSGATGSTTNVNIGPIDGGGTATLGQSTAASTVNIGTGATTTGLTKAVNIGTSGATGSTTNITLGSTTGTNAITLNGPTTFTGLVATPVSTTSSAGLRIPHGAQPTTPTNGDIWTQTNGLFAWINGSVKQFGNLQDGLIYSGNNTFSGPTLVFGNTTAASTVDIGTGATTTGVTKNINIGTNGVATSITNVTIGSANGGTTTTINGVLNATASNMTIGNNTGGSAYNFGNGATISGQTKAINIGTGGLTGSTTNIAIGSSSGGTNAITLNGPTTINSQFTASGANVTLGNVSASNSFHFIGTGATTTGLVKTVDIGTSGVAGSTTTTTIGTSSGGLSTTKINGSVQYSYISTATALTLSALHRFVVVTAAVAITLPTASTVTGTIYTINARIAGVTISSFKNLLGTDTTGITSGTSITIISDGTNWQQVQ